MMTWAAALAPVGALGAGYVSGVRRARHARGPAVPRWRIHLFAVGLTALALALVPHLDRAAESGLSWHMAQHLLLVAAAAPLLALGDTVPALLWALPDRERARLSPVWRRLTRAQERHWGVTVAVAGVAHLAVLVGWHAPVLYDAAVDHGLVHLAEHVTLLASAATFWWAVARGRAARRGAGVVVVFGAAFVPTVLAAGMTFAGGPWYRSYPSLADQQVAGVIMWVGGGFAYLIGALALFASWLNAADRVFDQPHNAGNRRVGAGSAGR